MSGLYNEHMDDMERINTESNMMHNKQFIDDTFEVKPVENREYAQISKVVGELQIHYHITMQYEPFFNYNINGPLLREFRRYLIGYFQSQYADYNWIDALIENNYFCFASDLKYRCNYRSDLNINISISTQQINLKYLKLQLSKAIQDGKIMFFADRAICGVHNDIHECNCERRRCIDNRIHSKWVTQLFQKFSTDYFIVYGNPAYMTFETHYHLMRKCNVLIGPHGASFALIMLMDEQQKVFELITKNSFHIANALNLIYYGYPLSTATKGTKHRIDQWQDYNAPVWFDVSQVINYLKIFLELNNDRKLNDSESWMLCKPFHLATFCHN